MWCILHLGSPGLSSSWAVSPKITASFCSFFHLHVSCLSQNKNGKTWKRKLLLMNLCLFNQEGVPSHIDFLMSQNIPRTGSCAYWSLAVIALWWAEALWVWNRSPQVQIKSFRTLPAVFCSYFKEMYTETRKDTLPAGSTRVFRDSGNASCPLTLSLMSTTCYVCGLVMTGDPLEAVSEEVTE